MLCVPHRTSPPGHLRDAGLLYSPWYSGSWSLRSRMVTVERGEQAGCNPGVGEASGAWGGRGLFSPMAQDAAPMPVRNSRVPTVRAATLGLEQHAAVRPPATDTKLGPLPGWSSAQQGLGTGPAPCPGMQGFYQAWACGTSSPISQGWAAGRAVSLLSCG